MSNERDQGFAALQRGDFSMAVPLLETACRNDTNDFYAYLYLGAAYGQANRAADAIQVLTRAVQIEPANPQARYNLGIALERGGWPQEAQTAFQQALTLQPSYPQATQALQRLQATSPQAPAPPSAASYPATSPDSAGLGSYAQAPTQQPYTMPGQASSPPQGYAPPSPYGAPPMNSALRPMTAAPVAYYEDRFDLAQAFKDWAQTIISPGRFFDEQAGREGLRAPMASLLAYALVYGVAAILGSLLHSGGPQLTVALVGALIMYPLILVGSFFHAWLLDSIGKWFGSTAYYSQTFRAQAYAAGPGTLVYVFSLLLLGITTGVTPAAMAERGLRAIFGLIALIWGLITLVIALSKIQRISTGAALGVAILSFVIIGVILFGFSLLLVGMFVATAASRGFH